MIAVAGSLSTSGVPTLAEDVQRSCGGTDLNDTSAIPSRRDSPPPQLPDDWVYTAESPVDVAKDLPAEERSSVAMASQKSAGSDAHSKRYIMKPVGASPPKHWPMVPHHGVAQYQYGFHPRVVVPQYYPRPMDGHFGQGRRGNHTNLSHVRPPPVWETSHRPPFYIGQGTSHGIAYPPPPRPYWGNMYRPDFRGMPYRPHPPHRPPPASLFYPASMPNDPMPSRIVKQIDYYFSESNLVKDFFLRSKMDSEGWVPISLIASFPRVKQLTKSIPFIVKSLRSSNVVEVEGNRIRKRDNWMKWTLLSIADSRIESNH